MKEVDKIIICSSDHDKIIELETSASIKFDNIDQKLLSICSSLVVIESKIDSFYGELCKRPTWSVLLPLSALVLGIVTAIFTFINHFYIT
jgi:hypothetical protein